MATVVTSGLGQAVRSRRSARGMSLRQLARRAGIPASSLSDIERDKVTPSWICVWRIAAILDAGVADLVAETEEEVPTR